MKRTMNIDPEDFSNGLPFKEWLRRKDAERRMRQKLINIAKSEIRDELFEIAQQD